VLLVRGRVDHKEAGDTKLVVQEVEVFEPTPAELERARAGSAAPAEPRHVTLQVDPGVSASFLEDLRDVVASFPGDKEIRLEIGARTLTLGPDYRVAATTACQAELAALAGVAQSVPDEAAASVPAEPVGPAAAEAL
jgi:DNA polymerase-3 subunit alpha